MPLQFRDRHFLLERLRFENVRQSPGHDARPKTWLELKRGECEVEFV
jgi:hypothetical protein